MGACSSAVVVAHALFLRAVVPRLLGVMSLPRLLQVLTPRRPRTPPVAPGRTIAEVFRLTGVVLEGRRWTGTTCLYRALIRYALLSRRGVQGVQLVLGVCDPCRDVVGHAWLELAACPLHEKRAPRYAVTYRHPPARPELAP